MKKIIFYTFFICLLFFGKLTAVFSFYKLLDTCVIPSLCKECIISTYYKPNNSKEIKKPSVLPFLELKDSVRPISSFLNSKMIEDLIMKESNDLKRKSLDMEGAELTQKQCWIECNDKEIPPKTDKLIFRISQRLDKDGAFVCHKAWGKSFT